MNKLTNLPPQSLIENKQKNIALVPGGYKPPTGGHFYIVNEISKRSEIDEVIVLIGHKERDGITKEDSIQIWDIYKKYLSPNVTIKLSSNPSPISDIHEIIRENPQNFYYPVVGMRNQDDIKDQQRFNSLKNKFSNFKPITIPGDPEISGTKARETISDNSYEKFQKYLPIELEDSERKKIWNIIKNNPKSNTKDSYNINQPVGELINKNTTYSENTDTFTKAGGQGILFANINEAVFKSNPLQNILREKYKDFLEKLIIIDKGEQLELNQIRILPKYRNQNIGSKIMTDIVKYADTNNKILTLTPTEDFGSTQDRLESFYKKFGFTNKKQSIKTDDTMVRPLNESKNHNIRYWALYSNIFNKLKDNPTVNYNIFKDKLQGEPLKALEYFYNTYFQNDVVSINENATYSENIDYKQHIKDLTKYYLTIYPNLTSMPKVKFIHNNKENAAHIHTKTGYYDPNTKTIVIYTEGRHPRDIINTFSHEIIHFMQDLEGRLTNINNDNTTQDTELNDIEKQAYLEGSIMFRNYKDSIKENTKLDPFGLIKIIHETFGS
jgi:hypothetical protein